MPEDEGKKLAQADGVQETLVARSPGGARTRAQCDPAHPFPCGVRRVARQRMPLARSLAVARVFSHRLGPPGRSLDPDTPALELAEERRAVDPEPVRGGDDPTRFRERALDSLTLYGVEIGRRSRRP